MPELYYRMMYLHLFNKTTDAANVLRLALKTGDTAALERAVLRVYAELTRAQCEAEEMYMSE